MVRMKKELNDEINVYFFILRKFLIKSVLMNLNSRKNQFMAKRTLKNTLISFNKAI